MLGHSSERYYVHIKCNDAARGSVGTVSALSKAHVPKYASQILRVICIRLGVARCFVLYACFAKLEFKGNSLRLSGLSSLSDSFSLSFLIRRRFGLTKQNA